MQLAPNEIHIWSLDLSKPWQANHLETLLTPEEKKRANQLIYPLHQQRFKMARAGLRYLLGYYLSQEPTQVSIAYTSHRKPYLAEKKTIDLQFNLSHSEDITIYAFTLKQSIGVDIEKIGIDDKSAVAKRFFSEQEVKQLTALSTAEKSQAFYRLWAKKEALLKAIGKGLTMPLSSFSVSIQDTSDQLILGDNQWVVMPIAIDPAYEAALAYQQTHKVLSYWVLSEHGIQFNKPSTL